MSRLVKTRGIIIRHSPTSETSRVVHWLTEDHGRIATIAKGALRPRNPFLGHIDHYYTCELIYYARNRDALFITREVSPIATRPRFRRDWRAALAARYFADLTMRVTPEHERVPEIFSLLDDVLNELEIKGWHPPLLHLFELRLLDLLGLAPRLSSCSSCGKLLSSADHRVFSSRRGGMVCGTCAPNDPNALQAGRDVAAMLINWQSARGWTVAHSARCTPKQLHTVRLLLGDFLMYHLDMYPGARESILDLFPAAQTGKVPHKIRL